MKVGLHDTEGLIDEVVISAEEVDENEIYEGREISLIA